MGQEKRETAEVSRRDFVAGTAAAAMTGLGLTTGVHAAGADVIKVGLVGCGGRGKGAALDAIEASDKVRVVAVADVFQDRANDAADTINKRPNQKVDTEHRFVGFDAFQKVVALDLDYVILATPPHFRPAHFEAAVKAGKHVFMEKPVAVDPAGCRLVMAVGQLAREKKLAVAAGTQRRHEAVYRETYKRILDGAIGKIVSGRVYWNQGQLWHRDRESGWNDMEWMIRDWVNWRWLSGDHIVEQHVHNLDVFNWFTSTDGGCNHPIKAVGMGGRVYRPTGDQYDFFSVDFDYADGVTLSSYCRQINDCANSVSEHIVGTQGKTVTASGNCRIMGPKAVTFQFPRFKQVNPYVQEHKDLIAAMEGGAYINEADNVAKSTLTAVMGRIAAYTGKEVTFDEMLKSDLRLGPDQYNWEVGLPEIVIPKPGQA